MFKRIIPFILTFSIILSSLTFSISAEDISSQTTTFWNMLVHSVWNTADQADVPYISPIAKGISSWFSGDVCYASDDGWHHAESAASSSDGKVNCLCRYCSETFVVGADALAGAYNNYVTDLPFTGYNSNGSFMLPIPVVRFSNGYSDAMPPQWTAQSSGNSYTASGVMYGSENGLYVYPEKVYAPVAGFYTFVHEFNGTGGASVRSESYYIKSRTHADAGFDIIGAGGQDGRIYIYGTSRDNSCFVSGQIWYKVEPDVPLSGDTYSLNTRPASIVGDYGIIGDDGTIIKVDGNMIVDESTNTVYNPVTNTTNNYTDYAFDYSDRSYNLTLEDGSTLKVVYGNENITIQEGDIVYNVYYLLPDSSEDPGGSGGSGDTPGTDDGSGWAWLQGAWTQMMDKLTGILEAITDLELSPEINVDVEVGGEEEVTQESWFSELLTKFAFITSVHDIYTQLVADVTSDAATAAAVADGEVMLADVTSGHAAIDGRASYTAPELAISFGSSDKYGVDWAGIRPLNLSWYAPHKETVDGILSGILWLSYLFLLIKRAPGIIRGSEMVTEDSIKIDNWRMRH